MGLLQRVLVQRPTQELAAAVPEVAAEVVQMAAAAAPAVTVLVVGL